jgi:hypothetical protein
MKIKIDLSDVFAAEQNQYHALYLMKQDIDYRHFDFAMHDQFEYLYWKDVFEELYEQYKVEYLEFKNHARGRA